MIGKIIGLVNLRERLAFPEVNFSQVFRAAQRSVLAIGRGTMTRRCLNPREN
jgi:hypothetical protein